MDQSGDGKLDARRIRMEWRWVAARCGSDAVALGLGTALSARGSDASAMGLGGGQALGRGAQYRVR